MTRIQPTTAIDMDKAGRSPCCDATLELASPPNVYECRECTRRYDTALEEQGESGESETDTCEVVLGTGDVCGRERPCQYHD